MSPVFPSVYRRTADDPGHPGRYGLRRSPPSPARRRDARPATLPPAPAAPLPFLSALAALTALPFRPALVCAGLLAAAVPALALAQSDATVYEDAMTRSAEICPGYATERARPGIRAVPVGALRVLAKRQLTLCPDRRLDAAAPVVWYGHSGVFSWNPEIDAAVELLKARVDAMSRREEFPVGTLVWSLDGNAVTGAVVPTFEPRPRPR